VREDILLDVSHRQVVFTIPKMLRIFFKYNRKLLGDLCRCAVRALLHYLRAATGSELMPGIIAVIQTSGRKLNYHPHLHLLITDGGVDEDGAFQKVSGFDDKMLAELFSREVFALLLHEGLITLKVVEKILSWRHSGFNVRSKIRARSRINSHFCIPSSHYLWPFLSIKILNRGPITLRRAQRAKSETLENDSANRFLMGGQ
jgi:hypothetical protein